MSPRAADDRLIWGMDGRDWPHRDYSRFIEAGGLRWHVQRMGEGPILLLVHGTGAATHSWRDLAPLLARGFTVIAPDLPGHGFTDPMKPAALSLPGMAAALAALLRLFQIEPAIVVGHSAGAALLARFCLDRALAPRLLVSLNGALLPFEGMAGLLFPPMAKLVLLNPLAPRLFAWSADQAAVARILRGTGSRIDRRGVELYARLLGNAGHVSGALGMMANWDLAALDRDLARLMTPVVLVAAQGDKAVKPADAEKARAMLMTARVRYIGGLGHLAHEETPDKIAELIFEEAAEAGVFAAG